MMRFVTNELRYILARVATNVLMAWVMYFALVAWSKKMFVVVLVSMMYRLFLVEYSDVYSMLIFFCKTLCIFVLVCSSYFIPCLSVNCLILCAFRWTQSSWGTWGTRGRTTRRAVRLRLRSKLVEFQMMNSCFVSLGSTAVLNLMLCSVWPKEIP